MTAVGTLSTTLPIRLLHLTTLLLVVQVFTRRTPSPFEPCEVEDDWPIANLVRGSMSGCGHAGALALDKNRRPSAAEVKDELERLTSNHRSSHSMSSSLHTM